MSRSLLVALCCALLASSVHAACPFAHLFGSANVPADGTHRKLLQMGPGPQGGQMVAPGGKQQLPQPGPGGKQVPSGGGQQVPPGGKQQLPQPGPGGKQPPQPTPGPKVPAPKPANPAPKPANPAPKAPTAPCDIAALQAAGPLNPPSPAQSEVDARVKQTAWNVLTAGAGATPGMGSAGRPNTNLPLGALVRMAFHDAGTYNRANNTGGANGSIRLELANEPSRGMQDAARLCTAWRDAINAALAADPQVPQGLAISFADTFQLAGAVAVIVTGGPSADALWAPLPVGRVDAPPVSAGPSAPADNINLLPAKDLDFGQLACLFLSNGYTIDELTTISGAHTIGFRAQPNAGPAPMTPTPFVFDGSDYYQMVLQGTAAFRTDNVLGRDPSTVQLVTQYAQDKASFHSAFAAVYVKMSKMGAQWQSYGSALLPASTTARTVRPKMA